MFNSAELLDLKQAFEAAAQGESYVNLLSLKTLFSQMGIFPSDEMLNELLKSCGKVDEEDIISFDLFARSVALLLEENAEKGSTSS
jgi:Ca2+-binding EF-hand superfamily protein